MSTWISFNGKILPANVPLVGIASRGFRYGDGLFETMLMEKGAIVRLNLHEERLSAGLHLLGFEGASTFTIRGLSRDFAALAERNALLSRARVRLMVFRGDGPISDFSDLRINYVLEMTPLPEHDSLNEKGYSIDVYPEARKACDAFANLKSNNFLGYSMATLYAGQQGFDECLVLNQHGRICDSNMANIFWIKNSVVHTPPLSEGCVAGTLRRHLLDSSTQILFKESVLSIDILEQADEIFLTNAVYGIRWVGKFRQSKYSHTLTSKIYTSLL